MLVFMDLKTAIKYQGWRVMRGNLASRERVLKYFIPQSILYILFFSIIETKGGFYIYETAKYHIMHSPAYFFK